MKKEGNHLELFFNPKTIAIIGASENTSKVGGILLEKALKSKSKIIPINPKHDILMGVECYKSVLDFPENIDLAVIAIPLDFVFDSLEECGKKRIKNVIVVSAGFSEVGNVGEEKKLLELAKKYKIRIIGPNCFGIVSPLINLDLTFSKTTPKLDNVINNPPKEGIAFLSQSGALWSFIADYFNGRINFSGFVGLGNMADLGFTDFIDYYLEDKNTKSIVLYIEKLKEGTRFIELCKKAITKGKKIYAVKVGSSEKGKEAAFSHTASLASDYLVYKGVFKQVGVEFCSSLEVAFELANGNKKEECKIINTEAKHDWGKTVIVTNAGGAGALLSDMLSAKEINLIEKPYDLLGTALANNYAQALEEYSIKADSIFVVITPQSMSELEKTAEVVCEFTKQTNKVIVPVFLGGRIMLEANGEFKKNKIEFFNSFESLRRAL